MLIVFATIVVEPDRRDQIVANMTERLEKVAPTQNGAIYFRLLLDANEPGTINAFQIWPDVDSFNQWSCAPIHIEFQVEFARFAKSISSVHYSAQPITPP